jgi:anti-sigma factor RsiW
MAEVPEATAGHPPVEEMVAYVRGRLDRSEHQRVEQHLAQCRLCANEIGDIVNLSEGRASRVRGVPLAAVAAAAAALFLVVWTGRSRLPDAPASTREEPTAGPAAPTPLSPSGSEPGRVVFRWVTTGGLRYRVVLFDSVGSALFENTTTDSMLALPDSLSVVPGGLYLWKVEVEVAPDRWVSSRVVEFRRSGTPP